MNVNKRLWGFLFLAVFSFSVSNGNCWPFKKHESKKPLIEAGKLYDDAKYPESISISKEIIENYSSSKIKAQAYWYLGKSYEELGDFDNALNTYQVAVQLYDKNMELKLALADFYYKVDLLDRAKNQYREILDKDENDFYANIGLAKTYEDLGFLNFSAQHYKKALNSKNAKSTDLKRNYAKVLAKQRKCVPAEEAALSALSDFNSDPDSWFLLSKIRYECGKKQQALSDIEKAYDYSPFRKDIAVTRILWLLSTGKINTARNLMEPLLKQNKNSALVFWTAGLVYSKTGDVKKAKEFFERAQLGEDTPFISKVSKLMESQLE
jgi:tetratricopeptide (TPR) repeat protein